MDYFVFVFHLPFSAVASSVQVITIRVLALLGSLAVTPVVIVSHNMYTVYNNNLVFKSGIRQNAGSRYIKLR